MTIINRVKYFMIFIRIFNLIIIYIEYNSPLYLNDNFFWQKQMLSYRYVYASISYQVKINVIENNVFSILSTRIIFLMSLGMLNFPPHNRNVYTRLSFQTHLYNTRYTHRTRVHRTTLTCILLSTKWCYPVLVKIIRWPRTKINLTFFLKFFFFTLVTNKSVQLRVVL
jgi:hypothetical protein